MTGEGVQQFDDAALGQLRRELIKGKRGGERQRTFLKAVRNGEDFLHKIRARVSVQGAIEPPLCPERLTEAEFKQPPKSTEEAMYGVWSHLTPRTACRTAFWTNLTCRHIENGRIEASFLAGSGGVSASGAERIDRALKATGDRAAKAVDGCVRTVLRRLGGLPEARGNRSVYVDCPLSRAWWRERLVDEVSKGDEEVAGRVREVSRINQAYWEELVVLVVSRNSILGSSEVRNQFILCVANLFEETNNETPLRIAKNLRAACRTVGVIQASRELSVLSADELHDILYEVVRYHHDLRSTRGSDG